MGWLDLWFDIWMMCLAHNYAVGNGAEEEQVSKYLGKVAVSCPPPLVLNVEPASDSHRFLESVFNTAGGSFSCHLWNPVVQALRGGDRMLLRMPGVGGGATKRDRRSLLDSPCWCCLQDGAGMLHTE